MKKLNILMIGILAPLMFSGVARAADLSDYSCELSINASSATTIQLARSQRFKQYEGSIAGYSAVVAWYDGKALKANLTLPNGTQISSPEFSASYNGDIQFLSINAKDGDQAVIACTYTSPSKTSVSDSSVKPAIDSGQPPIDTTPASNAPAVVISTGIPK